MNILIISNSEWDDNNSFGNTFSNFFKGIKNVNFANIFCRNGKPNTTTCNAFLKIDDRLLFNHLLNKKNNPVQLVELSNVDNNAVKTTSHSFIKRKRWSIFFLLRELLWSLSNYKNKEFVGFIEKFKPDILLLPTYPYAYINKMALWINKQYQLPIVSYISDDEFTLKRISFSPLFWILRLFETRYAIKTLRMSSIVYSISEVQQNDLQARIGVNSSVLTKFYPFSKTEFHYVETNHDEYIKFLYAGNIGNGRWKSLLFLVDAIEKVNKLGQGHISIDIYTSSPIPKRLQKKAESNCCNIKRPISYEELKIVQRDSDIVVHVESLSLKESLVVRQSFSTKIVDLFYSCKCIFAIGRNNEASILHLIKHNAGIVATNKNEIYSKLLECLNKDKRKEMAFSGFLCGVRNHNKEELQRLLENDLTAIAENRSAK